MATTEFYSQYNPHIHQQMPSLSLLTNTCNHYYPSRQDYSPLSSTGGEYGAVSPATTVSSTGSDGAYNSYSLYYNQYGGYAPPPPPPQSQSYRAAILPWQQTFTFDTMKYNGQPTTRRGGLNKCNCPNCLNDTGAQQRKGAGKRVHICHYPGCEKKYGKTSHLLAHIRSHTGERPYGCAWSFCGKRFTRSDECQRHYRTHTGDKRYQCKECPKKFIRSDHLKKHEKTHANPKKEKKNNDTTPLSTTSDKQQLSYSYSPINNQTNLVTKEANASSLTPLNSVSDNDSSTKSPTTNVVPYDYNHLSLSTNSIFDQSKKEMIAASSVPFSHTNVVSNNQEKKSPSSVPSYDYNSLSLSTSPIADNRLKIDPMCSTTFSPVSSVSYIKTKKSSPTLVPYEFNSVSLSSTPTYDNQSNRAPVGSNLVPFNQVCNNNQPDKSQSPFNYSSSTISDSQSNLIAKRSHASNLVQFGYGSLPTGDNNHLVLKREISGSNLILDPSVENVNILSHNNFIDTKTDLLTRHFFNLPYLT